jgi:hypothetical protein
VRTPRAIPCSSVIDGGFFPPGKFFGLEQRVDGRNLLLSTRNSRLDDSEVAAAYDTVL